MKKLLTLVILALSINVFGQTFPLSDFHRFPIPKVHPKGYFTMDTVMEANYFAVSSVNNKVIITPFSEQDIKEYTLSNGKFFTIDEGEFGGCLIFKPNDTTRKSFLVNGKVTEVNNKNTLLKLFLSETYPDKKILNEKHVHISWCNPRKMVPFDKGWLYIEGLAHMGSNYGSLWQINATDEGFTTSKILDLDSEPKAITIYHNKVYIATFYSLYCINNGKAEAIFDHVFWHGLQPNSIAVLNDKKIFVGLRSGYAQLDITKKVMKLYKYNK